MIPEDKAPQPDSPGISISCSASPTSLPVSRELQSYNMLCQGYIKNQNCSPASYYLDPLELLTRWQKKLEAGIICRAGKVWTWWCASGIDQGQDGG